MVCLPLGKATRRGNKNVPSELIKQLLEAGVHFGHQKKRWNPKMKKFIFGSRSGIYIIDLEKTEECINKARDFLLELTSKGDADMFIGNKKQAKEVAGLEKELAKLNKNFSGITAMDNLPKAVFVVDTKKEETAVKEAIRLSI